MYLLGKQSKSRTTWPPWRQNTPLQKGMMKNRDEVESKTFVLQTASGKGIQQDKKGDRLRQVGSLPISIGERGKR
jgi:hypothetical protein